MSKKNLFYVGLLLLAAGFAGCSSDDEDPLIAEGLKSPEFSMKDFSALEEKFEVEETTNGTWKIVKVNGLVQSITFGDNPSPEALKSPEDFFNEYLPVTAENAIQFSEKDNSGGSHYRQYYKGVPVERGTWHFEYRGDNILYALSGTFVPIEQLDITPTINESTAKKIAEKYLENNGKETGEGLDKHFYLTIMSFPAGNTMKPRLVYAYKQEKPVEGGDYVYVDAHAGRLLLHLSYHGGTPDF